MPTSRFSAVSRRAFLSGVSLAALTGLAACADSSSSTSSSSTTTSGASQATSQAPTAAASTAASSAAASTGSATGTLPATARATVSFTYAAGGGGGMVKNPYYAVWVEDANGSFVKTLLLCHLAGQDRWLNELSAWYQASGGNDTTTEGTKPAGSYTATWDGTDANGQRVAAGEYTICIESNREHGQESLVTSKQELGSSPLDVDLGTNGELTATHLGYTV